jgi:hypothetical protein
MNALSTKRRIKRTTARPMPSLTAPEAKRISMGAP